MKHRVFHVHSLVLAVVLVMLAGTAASAITSVDAKIRTAIERTQSMQGAISRCMSADDKVCADGLALAKVAKEAADTALNQSEVKDAAKSHLRTAIDHLNAVTGFLGQGRASEALPVSNNALASLIEADKAS